MPDLDWNRVAECAARELRGEPNPRLCRRGELRWGTRGSFVLFTAGDRAGVWRDWESGRGGRGAVQLAEYLLGVDRTAALSWLRLAGLLEGSVPSRPALVASVSAPSRVVSPDVALRLWRRSSSISLDAAHPARLWLSRRRLWRGLLPVPPSLRWLPAGPQHRGAGSIVCLLAPPVSWASAWPDVPDPHAVQLLSLDSDGAPALDRSPEAGGLSKRTLGPALGSVFVVGSPLLPDCVGAARVAEGVADALALASRYPGAAVATLGTSGMAASDLAGWLATACSGVVIHADADGSSAGRAPAGITAAGRLRYLIACAGGSSRASYPPPGCKDVADAAAALGFAPLPEAWIDCARYLRSATCWPRHEVARVAQSLVAGGC